MVTKMGSPLKNEPFRVTPLKNEPFRVTPLG